MSGYTYLVSDGRLAQGSAPPVDARVPFDTIVLAAMEYQPRIPGYDVVHAPLDDRPYGPPPTADEKSVIRSVAHDVVQRIRAGQRVLVTCRKGRNRSGVISGLALVELGLPRERAVDRIVRLRDGLANPYFRAMVRGTL